MAKKTYFTKRGKDAGDLVTLLADTLCGAGIQPLPTQGFKSEIPKIDVWCYTFGEGGKVVARYEYMLKNGVYKLSFDLDSLPVQVKNKFIESAKKKYPAIFVD